MKSRFTFLVVSILAVFSMLLTACGGDATPTTVAPGATDTPAAAVATNTTGAAAGVTAGVTNTASSAAATTPTEAGAAAGTPAAGGADLTPSAPPAKATSTPKPGQTVARFRLSSEPDTTDPQKMSFVNEIGWGSLAWEGLLELNEKLEPVPAAAAKMDVSADGLKYTLTLRDGLKYADGTPLTAKNFEYAWRRLFDPTLAGRDYASVAYDIKGSQDLSEMTDYTDTAKLKANQDALGIAAPDDKTIVFTLSSPVTYFPYILSLWTGWPTRESDVTKGGASWTEPGTYVGNGPYVLREWNHGSGAVWESNPNFRKGEPKIGRLEVREITESQIAFQAYKEGALDWLYVAAEDLKTVNDDPTLKAEYQRVQGNCNFYLGFNNKKAPFDNIKVRQAFARAFDRADYVDVVVKGQGAPALSFIPPNHPGYSADVKQPEFDATAAKQMLDAVVKSDYPNGLPPLKLTYSASARNKTRMEWVQNQIKLNLGVDAQLDPVEPKAYSALTKTPATTPQFFFLGWCQDYPDPQDWLSLVFRSESTVNHVQWDNKKFDDLTKQADIEKDATKRADLYKQAQQLLADEAPVVFIYWDVNDVLIKPYVQGLKEHASPSDAIVPGFINLYAATIKK
jgi:oligopeptide transport system substrate-binding protein